MSEIDLDSIFGNEKAKIECSNCNREFQIKLKQAFDNKKITCPHCRTDNSEKLDNKTKRKLKDIDKALKSLN